MYPSLGEVEFPNPAQQFYLEPGLVPFDVTLTSAEAKRDLSQYFEKDSEFIWTGLSGTQTGVYKVQFQLPDGRFMSSSLVNNANCVGTAQFPVPVFPAVIIPAGGKIGINITDTSASGNTVQIVFIGHRRYRSR